MMWHFFEVWRAFWRHLLAEPERQETPQEEARRLEAQDLHEAFKKHIADQERIRCLLDKNIQYARSLDQDVMAVVTDMVARRDESSPPQ